MPHDPDKAANDRRYNFDCPGCRKRRNKRAARMIAGQRYCQACAAIIDNTDQLPPAPVRTVLGLEERGRQDMERAKARLAWQDRRERQKRGQL